ncbi:signal transduction histidine kinase [Candidatus Magnetomorum sp. HK-1]|nr:signal transduction histidine kinase [Candidatus Magnetomorum sp. HK-1]
MNAKILIIDDESDILKMVERILLLEDYQVSTALSGKQAMSMLYEENFDLVVTDIRMPEMDGLEVIERVKAHDDLIEIIVLSGYATLDNAIDALKNGRAFHFVMKPLNDIESFYHIISQALEKRHLRIQNQQLIKDLELVNKDLEKRVNKKTEDLSERLKELESLKKELTQALQKAECANQAKSDFINIMNHEMKTPLNIILGNTELLLVLNKEREKEEYLNNIKKTCISFSELLDDIMLFTRLEKNEKDAMNENFTVQELMKDIEKILQQRANEKGLSFQVNIDDQVPQLLLGKWRLIRQVILNLTGNAIKFTEKGGCAIHIKTNPLKNHESKKEEYNHLDLIVEISDTGIGVNEEQKKFIFDWFSQAEPSMTRRYGGIGLGLSICKKLVDLMNGKIWVESQENVGSRFIFKVSIEEQSKEILFRTT